MEKEPLSNINENNEPLSNSEPTNTNTQEPQVLTKDEVIKLIEAKSAKVKKVRLTGGATIVILMGSLLGAGLGFVFGSAFTNASVSEISNTGKIVIENPESVNWMTAAALKATPSVVSIISRSEGGEAAGSGIVYSEDGYIVSSAHLFQHSQFFLNQIEAEVRFSNGEVETAKVVNVDLSNDIAVLKLDNLPSTYELVAAEWRDSDTVEIGERVIAIGSPLELYNSVTQGIVSSTDRVIQLVKLLDTEGYSDLGFVGGSADVENGITVKVIQTDAAINPGNSGGGLVDSEGKFIGLNAAISGGDSVRGIGFSIPSNNIRRFADSIIANGGSTNGLLGAIVGNKFFSSNSITSFSVGALVAEVSENGPAAKAGIKSEYVITQAGDVKINSASDLVGVLRTVNSGTKVSLSGYYLTSPDETVSYEVELGSAPNGL